MPKLTLVLFDMQIHESNLLYDAILRVFRDEQNPVYLISQMTPQQLIECVGDPMNVLMAIALQRKCARVISGEEEDYNAIADYPNIVVSECFADIDAQMQDVIVLSGVSGRSIRNARNVIICPGAHISGNINAYGNVLNLGHVSGHVDTSLEIVDLGHLSGGATTLGAHIFRRGSRGEMQIRY